MTQHNYHHKDNPLLDEKKIKLPFFGSEETYA